jgi:hypothetical protein
MMNVLYLHDTGVNTKELHIVLNLMKNLGYIDLTISNNPYINLSNFDVLIYQTFPHENHPEKWKHSHIKAMDNAFLKFEGFKILHDAHDSGNVDAFKRFNDNNIPRIKAWPSYKFMKDYNVIMTTAGGTGQITDATKRMFFSSLEQSKFEEWKTQWPTDKENSISYIVSYGYHETKFMDYPTFISLSEENKFIRENTRDVLNGYSRVPIDMKKKSQADFYKHLSKTLVSVSVPGWGEGCLRQYEAPLFGCLNLLHESISDIKLLPHADLVDGEDFISFNLENLKETLDFIFDNRELVDSIRYNGKRKLHIGYDLSKSAEMLNKILKENV